MLIKQALNRSGGVVSYGIIEHALNVLIGVSCTTIIYFTILVILLINLRIFIVIIFFTCGHKTPKTLTPTLARCQLIGLIDTHLQVAKAYLLVSSKRYVSIGVRLIICVRLCIRLACIRLVNWMRGLIYKISFFYLRFL